jgi:hypothetical protein
MTEIYSKIEPDKLLHFIIRSDEINVSRFDAVCDKERLQVAILNMKKGRVFKAHRHNTHKLTTEIPAQESWVLISGKVMVCYYDIEGDKCIETAILNPGDLSFTLYGGHSYEAMEDGTRVYEFKTGYYLGQEHDKTFI